MIFSLKDKFLCSLGIHIPTKFHNFYICSCSAKWRTGKGKWWLTKFTWFGWIRKN